MSDLRNPLHTPTEVLTRGFDPTLSVGSARPAVFRSSTYVFPSPEVAEHAFDLMAGRAKAQPGESVPLVYSRFNHPNAEILEDQVLPLEPGAAAALVFNSGMSAIVTALMAHLRPGHNGGVHGADLRRDAEVRPERARAVGRARAVISWM